MQRKTRTSSTADAGFFEVFRNSPVGVALSRPEDGYMLDVNDAALEIVGLRRDEIVGRISPESGIWADPAERRATAAAALAQGAVRDREVAFRHASGELRRVLLSVERREVAGTTCLLTYLLDVTETRRKTEILRESEERFRHLFATMAQGVIYQNAEAPIVFANPAACRIMGLTEDQLLGRTSFDPRWHVVNEDGTFCPPESHPSMLALRTGKPQTWATKGVFNPREEAYRWLRASAVPLFRPGEEKPFQVYLTFEDVTDLKRAREELRDLAGRVQTAREEERAQVSRDLHDEVLQTLSALRIGLVRLERRLGARGEEAGVGYLLGLADETLEAARRIATDLRPPLLDTAGLPEALHWQAGEFSRRHGVPCLFEAHGGEVGLGPEAGTALYRIFQEALTNVARHAGAFRVEAALWEERAELILEVRDDGKGFEPSRAGAPTALGLLGMRERALALGGRVDIETAPGAGTRVLARIPVLKRKKRGKAAT